VLEVEEREKRGLKSSLFLFFEEINNRGENETK
jgi:hypothetical protein